MDGSTEIIEHETKEISSSKDSPANMTAFQMIDRAMERGADLDTIKQLIELKNAEEDRESEKSFKAAIAKAKLEFKPIIKTGYNKHLKSHYPTLNDISLAVDDALARHGLVYTFETGEDGDKHMVTCVLTHEGGHSTRTTLKAKSDVAMKNNALHGLGSTTSYLKRYTLEASIGISAGNEEDDGNSSNPLQVDQSPWFEAINQCPKEMTSMGELRNNILKDKSLTGATRIAVISAFKQKMKMVKEELEQQS